jgi:hypothetical protein
LIFGLVVATGLFFLVTRKDKKEAQTPPQIAGQNVPERYLSIDFTKAYDIYLNDKSILRRCKIIGFTGTAPNAPQGRFDSGEYSRFWDKWLVIQFSDKRLAYFTPGTIKRLEEVAVK